MVCPPLIGSENKNEPITQPTRPLKNLEKIHCATLCEENIRSYAPKNLGTFQGSLGGTNLTRIGPETNILPPHSELKTGFDAPGRQPKGGCLPHGSRGYRQNCHQFSNQFFTFCTKICGIIGWSINLLCSHYFHFPQNLSFKYHIFQCSCSPRF